MTGAIELEPGKLNGKILLNLDTEDDDELTIGCAGGIDITARSAYDQEATPDGAVGKRIVLKGMTGGHSGMDIHKGRGNSNKLMNRVLKSLQQFNPRIADLEGGGLRNAIPRESFCVLAVPASHEVDLEAQVNKMNDELTL